MLAKSQTCAVVGLDGFIVQVEVDISNGLPAFNVVGLPDTAVQEARERVRAALRNSGCQFPMRRITVNLAPADLKKAGPAYDLPIAVGILLSSGQIDLPDEPSLFLGELSLDGSLRHTNGVLPMVSVAREQGFSAVYVPTADAAEAALVEGIQLDCLMSGVAPPLGAISLTSRARNTRNGQSRWRQRVSIISCSVALRAAARRCWPGLFLPYCRR